MDAETPAQADVGAGKLELIRIHLLNSMLVLNTILDLTANPQVTIDL